MNEVKNKFFQTQSLLCIEYKIRIYIYIIGFIVGKYQIVYEIENED